MKLTEEREMNFSMSDMMQRFGNRDGDNEDPMGELRRESCQLDTSTMESLEKLLSASQVSRLPQEEDRGGFGGRQQGDRRQQQTDRGRGGQRQQRDRF